MEPSGGELDGQRETGQPPTHVQRERLRLRCHLERRLRGPGSIEEQSHRVRRGRCPVGDLGAEIVRLQRERREPPGDLALHGETLPTRGKDVQVRAARKKLRDQRPDSHRQMLTVVEDQQGAPAPQLRHQPGREIRAGPLEHPERPRHL